LTTAETKAEIERIFQEFREMDEQDGMAWKVPLVDVQAIAHDMEEIRRGRKDFCIPAKNRGHEVDTLSSTRVILSFWNGAAVQECLGRSRITEITEPSFTYKTTR
jgi:hypothetical protein